MGEMNSMLCQQAFRRSNINTKPSFCYSSELTTFRPGPRVYGDMVTGLPCNAIGCKSSFTLQIHVHLLAGTYLYLLPFFCASQLFLF